MELGIAPLMEFPPRRSSSSMGEPRHKWVGRTPGRALKASERVRRVEMLKSSSGIEPLKVFESNVKYSSW